MNRNIFERISWITIIIAFIIPAFYWNNIMPQEMVYLSLGLAFIGAFIFFILQITSIKTDVNLLEDEE